jgi:WD40 repeat protein
MKYLFKLSIFALCFWGILPIMDAQPDSTRRLIGFAHDNTPIHSLQFSKDGNYLMAISGSVVIWDVAKREKVFTHTMPNMIQNACLAKDTNLLAIRHKDNEIFIMEANHRTVLHQIPLMNPEHAFVKIVAFVHENQSLMVQQDRFHYFYDIKTGKLTHKQAILSPQYFINGWDSLITTVEQNKIKIYNVYTNQFLNQMDDESNGTFQQLHYYGPFMAIRRDDKIHLCETATYKSLIPNYLNICYLAEKETFFGLDLFGNYYLVGYDTLKLWDATPTSEKWVRTPLIFGNKITNATFSPYISYKDTIYLAAGDALGNIKIWAFTDENVAAHYYKDEIQKEIAQIRQPYGISSEGERDRVEWYYKKIRSIHNKYLGKYSEKITSGKLPIDLFYEDQFPPEKK